MLRFLYRFMDLAPWVLLGVAAYAGGGGHDPSYPWLWVFLAAGFGFLRRIFFGYHYPDGLANKEG